MDQYGVCDGFPRHHLYGQDADQQQRPGGLPESNQRDTAKMAERRRRSGYLRLFGRLGNNESRIHTDAVFGGILMTGRDLIKWIQDNQAEDLPVMIRRPGETVKEMVTEKDLDIRVSIAGDGRQMEYKKYFLI